MGASSGADATGPSLPPLPPLPPVPSTTPPVPLPAAPLPPVMGTRPPEPFPPVPGTMPPAPVVLPPELPPAPTSEPPEPGKAPPVPVPDWSLAASRAPGAPLLDPHAVPMKAIAEIKTSCLVMFTFVFPRERELGLTRRQHGYIRSSLFAPPRGRSQGDSAHRPCDAGTRLSPRATRAADGHATRGAPAALAGPEFPDKPQLHTGRLACP
jgi:hypothetical protein